MPEGKRFNIVSSGEKALWPEEKHLNDVSSTERRFLPEGGDVMGRGAGAPEKQKLQETERFLAVWCPKPGSNRHVFKEHWILSPARLPIPPFGHRRVR